MYCISINYKQLKTESREAFSMQEKEQEAFFSRIQKEVSIDGVILLMTCNRCEIYAAGSKDTMSVIERIWLAQKPGKEELFYEHIMRYEKENAIRHLYCVICGLDSAVLGEVEIIHQIKAAYLFSKAHDRQPISVDKTSGIGWYVDNRGGSFVLSGEKRATYSVSRSKRRDGKHYHERHCRCLPDRTDRCNNQKTSQAGSCFC